MFGFVGYQLWGTGLEYAQAQDQLDDEFEELLAGAPATRETFRRAAAAELEHARPVEGNEFKIPMAQGVMVSVLAELAGLAEDAGEPEEARDE